MDNGFGQCFGAELRRILREDKHVGAEGAKLGGESAFGVNLEIEEGRSDRRACTQGQQHYKEPPTVRAEEAADDAPKHGSIRGATVGHHSPRRMGAGS